MIKKYLLKVSVITLLTLSLFNPISAEAKTKDIRIMKATVIEVNNGNVLFSTEDGNGWYLEYVKGYKVNQKYKIKFDTMGTESIYDDEIIKLAKIK